ncbi:MAG: protein-export membrane protein SecD [Candidatus Magasanikbacteria bacterium RIFCSPHIGHO2_01_FULL_50_8]|uniref:Protein translocase subunit SecD n=1 Tax=Candidatus Magasanikbacteria bacterium RIFCSPHIGHO2_01_FULL_50_8 TaxID=1798674 RepID=A0A1F6LU59_9BACT|nr:MAG: protein-export membrane protein SecD [Candidatus Magasanikbacteria bacterium RIFCSPHIGHO2_01_FULL_50_8]
MKLRSPHAEIPRHKIRNGLIAVVVIALFAAGYAFPDAYNTVSDALDKRVGITLGHLSAPTFRLGLDLRGGAYLMYDVETRGVAESERASAVEGARDVIERRVNAFGVGEPLVQTTKVRDTWRVLVELPDVHDVAAAIEQIGATPILEFRDKSGDGAVTAEQQKQIAAANKKAKDEANAAAAVLKKGATFDELFKSTGTDLGFISKEQYGQLFAWGSRVQKGAISPAIDEADAVYIAQRGDDKKDPVIKARHILICWKDAQGCATSLSKAEAEQKIKDLMLNTSAQTFADLAKVHSVEPGAAQTGGDLGEIRKGDMVAPFEAALLAMKVGEIKGPVETQFGYHIIYKSEQRDEQLIAFRALAFDKQAVADFELAGGWKSTGLSGKQLERAAVEFDPNTGEPTVNVQFNSEGKELFAQITKRNLEQQVGIFLDGELISSPVVRQPITDGRAVISGGFTLQEAKKLAERLNAGALPLPVKLVSQQTVGATLGTKSLEDSATAGLIGFALVLLFLTAFYRLPGLLASAALVAYVVVVLAVFKFIPVTLTLAGIAGFILSMGMAVDANVLVFERTREELKTGKSPQAALEEAFPRAWNSIRDSNVSSLITCAILFWFGSSIVQGFALTLAIGILASLFTAITVTRLLLRFCAPYLKDKPALFVQSKK